VNQSPFGEAWMLKLKITDRSEVDALLSADDYAKLIG
jgi:glycine cleavage system H protein